MRINYPVNLTKYGFNGHIVIDQRESCNRSDIIYGIGLLFGGKSGYQNDQTREGEEEFLLIISD